MQKETNTCGFFCMLFALEAEKYNNFYKLKEDINNNKIQTNITNKVLELVGKEKILLVRQQYNNKITESLLNKTVDAGQGFGAQHQKLNNCLQHPNQPRQNNIIKGIKLRQQKAEESFVERYRKAREKRDIERKNSIYYYGK